MDEYIILNNLEVTIDIGISRCYKCGRYQDLTCCEKCGKWMCPDHLNDMIGRGLDATWEKVFGYSKNWFPEGKC